MNNIKILCCIVLLWIPALFLGQNLIKNPSLEEFNNCPEALGTIDEDVPFWTKSSNGTTDYFNKCSVGMGIPSNFNGEQIVEFGNGYAGLYLFAPNNYKEYIQGELSETLVKDVKYEVSFYISLAEKSKFAIRDVGFLLSKKKIKEDTRRVLTGGQDKNLKKSYNFSEIRKWDYYKNKADWTLVKTTITARGDENYLTIGNFKSDSHTKVKRLKGQKSVAYYYLDMVSVIRLHENYPYNDLVYGQTYILENVQFPTNIWELDNRLKLELNKLYAALHTDPLLNITIHAHTDDVGSPEYNKNLSTKRAASVAEYLVSLGIDEKRISSLGHGGDRPVEDNSTEKGRKKNRRAEFTVFQHPSDDNSITRTLFDQDDD